MKIDKLEVVCLVLLVVLWIAGATPVPTPTPDIDPVPPTPDERLIDVDGYSVLIVFDPETDYHRLTPEQTDLIKDIQTSGEIRRWLDSNTNWKVYEGDENTSVLPEVWAEALARPRTEEPWVIISGNTGGEEGKFPANVEEMKSKLEKYK